MSNGNGLVEGVSPNPFEPIRGTFRFEMPPAALGQLSGLAKIPAHYRPTFANAAIELFAKAHRWHRMANRSVEMDAAAKELNRVAKEAGKLKKNIDKLSKQARVTLGLYAMRLERFGEAESHEAVRNQIEDLLHSAGAGQAVQKVDALSWAVGRIGSAAATETWPKCQKSNPAPWKRNGKRKSPYVDTFNLFMIELGVAVRACNGALRLERDDMGDDLKAFLRAASLYLPNEFIPNDVLYPGANRQRAAGWRLKKLMSLLAKK